MNSGGRAIAAAEAGSGITRPLSYKVKESVVAGRLVPLLQEFAPPALPVSALHPQRRIASANVTAFIAAARHAFIERRERLLFQCTAP